MNCNRPPAGWNCSRSAGHPGPCAALPLTADERILSALRRVERAQTELNEACSDLSPVIGLVKPWEDCGKLADRVKSFWHKLNGRFLEKRGQWRLDQL